MQNSWLIKIVRIEAANYATRSLVNSLDISNDITSIIRESLEQLVPLVATGNQYLYYWGETQDVLRRALISVTGVVTLLVLTSFVAGDLGIVRFLLGWTAGLYWLWVPVYLASQRNAGYRRYPFGGLWQGQVFDVYVSEELIARLS